MSSGLSNQLSNRADDSWQSRAGRIAAVVSGVRLRMVAVALATGLLLTLAAAIAWVVGGVLLDLAAPLSVPLRVAVCGGWLAVVAAATAAFVLLPAVRRPLVDAVALRIERALGGMHNRLLTVVDIARGGTAQAGGRRLEPDMVERLLAQTQALLAGFRPSAVIRWRALARSLLFVLGGAAALAGLHLVLGERLLVTLERLWNPTADIPPATWLTLRAPGDVDVLEGEPLVITGSVTRGTVDGADLVVYDEGGRAVRYPMRAGVDGGFTVTLDGLDAAARYRIEGGGTWTRTHAIRLLERPEILAVAPRIVLPPYMRIDAPLPVDPESRRIEAPLESTVEFVAAVTPDVAEGSLNLFGRRLETRTVERFDERVWFEDDLPRDAVEEQPWRWTTAHAAGGLRSFTFGHDGRPFAMRTRLEPLVLPREQVATRSVMVMARLDPADPPGRLAMLLDCEGGRTELVWGDAGSAPPPQGFARVVAGPLPTPGAWTRLSKPLAELPQLIGRSVGSVTFSIDRGRVLLDRPGWVERSTESVSEPVDHPTGSLPMRRDEAGATDAASAGGTALAGSVASAGSAASAGAEGAAPQTPQRAAWIGGLPVAAATWAALEFRSREGHPTLPQAAVEIVPTVDKPPAIIVEDPPEVLTLEVVDDLPLRGRVFDDWGIDAVLVRTGPDAKRLGAPEPLAGVTPAVRPPDTLLAFDAALSAERLGLEPGRSAAFTLLVRDTKGQVTETKPFVVSVVLPPEHALARLGVPGLEQARREAEQAARNADRKAEELDARREEVLEAVGREPLDALDAAEKAAREAALQAKPDDKNAPLRQEAKEKTAAAQQAADQAVKDLEKPLRADMAKIDAQLEERSREADRLAKSVKRAAEQAAKNPLVPKPQQERLAGLAKDSRQLAEALEKSDQFKGDAAKLDRMADAPEAAEVAEETRRLAEALGEVEREIDAAGAARRLESLAQDLDRRAEALERARQARAERAAEEGAAPQSPQDRQADAAARGQIQQLQQILGRAAKPQETAATQTAAPQPDAAKPDAAKPAADAAAAAKNTREPAADAAAAAKNTREPAADAAAMAKNTREPAADEPAAAKMEAAKQPPGNDAPADPAEAAEQPTQAMQQPAPQPPDPVSRALLDALAAAAETARATETLADQLAGRRPVEPPASKAGAGERAAATPAATDPGENVPAAKDAATNEPGKNEPGKKEAGKNEAGKNNAGENEAGRGEPDAGAGEHDGDGARAEAIADLLKSREVQRALDMAERARRLAAQAAREAAAQARKTQAQAAMARQPGAGEEAAQEPTDQDSEAGTDGGAMAGRTEIQPGDPLRGLDAARRAAIYKLPPRVRDPLLEGMRQKGPAAYQDVIDTYFRQLGRDIPQ